MFPKTNKQAINETVGDNAKMLEESVKTVNWRLLTRAYLNVLGLVLVTIFSLIITVRLALSIF